MEHSIRFGYFLSYDTSHPCDDIIKKKNYVKMILKEFNNKLEKASYSKQSELEAMGDNLLLVKVLHVSVLETLFVYYCTKVSSEYFFSICELEL
jgi:hypothetical protein